MNCPYNCIEGMVFNEVLKRDEPCPLHSNAGDIFEKPKEKQIDILKSMNIPEGFDLTRLFDEQLLNTYTVTNSFTAESIHYLKEKLVEINTAVMNRRVHRESLYFYTPAVDIKAFAYALMVKATEVGLKVAPLVSVNTLFDIQRSREFDYTLYNEVYEGVRLYDTLSPREKQFYDGYLVLRTTNRPYRDFLDSDILFIEATANTSNASWVAVADILAERATRNKPTYILGYWSSRQLQGNNAKFVFQTADWSQRLSKLTTVELVSTRYEQGNNSDSNNYSFNNKNRAQPYQPAYKPQAQPQPYAPQNQNYGPRDPYVSRDEINQHIQQYTEQNDKPKQPIEKQETFTLEDYDSI